MAEIKNCPFCGGKAELGYNDMDIYYVSCNGENGLCSAAMLYNTDEKEAIELWNKRS